ncbi:MAG: V-type ATPase subunit [Spirochaetota bacterium]
MLGPVRKYGFINAKLRARISRLLPQDITEKLIKAPSLDEAVGCLRDTPFGVIEKVYRQTGDLKKGELELFKYEVDLYGELEKYVQGRPLEVVRGLAAYYEIENLKNALRLFFDRTIRKRNIEDGIQYLYRQSILYHIPVDAIINSDTMEQVDELLQDTPYAEVIERYGHTVARDRSIFFLEVGLDHFYYDNLMSKLEQLSGFDRKNALVLVGVEIDLKNINWLVRFRNFYNLPLEQALSLIIPRGTHLSPGMVEQVYTSQNVSQVLSQVIEKNYPGVVSMLSGFEKEQKDIYSRLLLIQRTLEAVMMHQVSRVMGGYPFTIGIVLCYFILKKKEVNKVQTILNAKKYHIPEERIRRLL